LGLSAFGIIESRGKRFSSYLVIISKLGGINPSVAARAKFSGRLMAAEQSRAARAWLGWSQDELANRAHVSVNTVRNFESGQKQVHFNSIASMQLAIEAAGIRLLLDKMGRAIGIALQQAEID
jgi:DNA-binding XRE family transcriptional regulator